ncbi:MAG: hypothetical protein RBU37_11410 [Myxococcota bacterium]|nr:hypothetical protein [Myxococcota bacterium]
MRHHTSKARFVSRLHDLPSALAAVQRQRRGAALLIALFTMLLITGMGLLAVQSASEETYGAANFRINKQAEHYSFSAMNAGIAEFIVSGDAYWTVMKQNALATTEILATADKGYQLTPAKLGPMIDATPAGELQGTPANFAVTINNPLDGYSADGFSGGKLCFKRFSFLSTSALNSVTCTSDAECPTGFVCSPRIFGTFSTCEPSADSTTEVRDRTLRFSTYSHRAMAMLGPIDCEGANQ